MIKLTFVRQQPLSVTTTLSATSIARISANLRHLCSFVADQFVMSQYFYGKISWHPSKLVQLDGGHVRFFGQNTSFANCERECVDA